MGDGFESVKSKYRKARQPKELSKDVFALVKTHYRHKDYDVKRDVAHIENSRYAIINNIAVIIYSFLGPEQKLLQRIHGNLKTTQNSYTRIKPGAQNMSVTQAAETHIADESGQENRNPEKRPTKQ